ncbi:hypothetical protein [Bythopirellula polymerisocia]|uniref:Uncharacterized protein n=1 Tax=Bythopirellula polymerisocia TaxID=2528003 RepID=A0A5C6CX75_9BACT|nr:hypothetical protein [Bythopirellula polymerisocia]TWU27626.1 hypothetical protein Pla144_24030 [Bythopirellula polymerisocia]
MSAFVIIDNDDGLVVAKVEEGQTGEQVAVANAGVLIDAGPFSSYEDAFDAMQLIPDPLDDLHGAV